MRVRLSFPEDVNPVDMDVEKLPEPDTIINHLGKRYQVVTVEWSSYFIGGDVGAELIPTLVLRKWKGLTGGELR